MWKKKNQLLETESFSQWRPSLVHGMNVECVSSAQTWKLIRVSKKTYSFTPELKESLLEVAQILILQQNFMLYGLRTLHILPVLQWNGSNHIISDMRISQSKFRSLSESL